MFRVSATDSIKDEIINTLQDLLDWYNGMTMHS